MESLLKLTMVIIMFVGVTALALTPSYLIASAITSGVKTVSGDCGKRYPVEAVLAGNFFCPTKK